MELSILSALILISLLINLVALRYYAGSLAKRLPAQTIPSFTTTTYDPKAKGNFTFVRNADGSTYQMPVDKPSQNQITPDDENDVDLMDQPFTTIPGDIKIEVEGGDTQTPPGFDEEKGGKK